MPVRRLGLLVPAIVLLASACAGGSSAESAPPKAAAPERLVGVSVKVPDGMNDAPFDVERRVVIPQGWSMSVFARVPSARLAAWAPDDTLLVSVPKEGTVVRLTRDGQESVVLDG